MSTNRKERQKEVIYSRELFRVSPLFWLSFTRKLEFHDSITHPDTGHDFVLEEKKRKLAYMNCPDKSHVSFVESSRFFHEHRFFHDSSGNRVRLSTIDSTIRSISEDISWVCPEQETYEIRGAPMISRKAWGRLLYGIQLHAKSSASFRRYCDDLIDNEYAVEGGRIMAKAFP